MIRSTRWLATAAMVGLAWLAGSASSVAAVAAPSNALSSQVAASTSSRQFTLFNTTMTHRKDAYWQPTTTRPSNWVSPVNFAAGTTYMRVRVIDKPSSMNIRANVCFWRNSMSVETCATKFFFSDEGTYYIAMGAPNQWWKKNGNFRWDIPFEVTRLMFKDAATGKLLLTRRCGSYCYNAPDIDQHVPITVQAEFIVVAKGSRLNPPASWAGCPSTWSSECPSPR
jgi:hypothetical protein